jgi:hypothetical protein
MPVARGANWLLPLPMHILIVLINYFLTSLPLTDNEWTLLAIGGGITYNTLLSDYKQKEQQQAKQKHNERTPVQKKSKETRSRSKGKSKAEAEAVQPTWLGLIPSHGVQVPLWQGTEAPLSHRTQKLVQSGQVVLWPQLGPPPVGVYGARLKGTQILIGRHSRAGFHPLVWRDVQLALVARVF